MATAVAVEPFPVSLVDGRGATVIVQKQPLRVISLAPSTTEIALDIGGVERLVAVTEHCTLPSSLEGLKRLPVYPQPSTEAILALKPDLVLAADITSRGNVEQLRRLNLKVIVLNSAGLDGIVRDIETMGIALGLENSAQAVVRSFQQGRQRVKQALQRQSPDEKPTVLFALGDSLEYFAGKGVFADSLIEEAGGRNVGATAGLPWPQLSAEAILQADPQVIFITGKALTGTAREEALAKFEKHPVWKGLQAVRNRRVYWLDSELFSVPGTRMKSALQVLFAHLYPDLAVE